MSDDDKINVLVVEDHLVARMGLRTLIDNQADMRVIDEARSGAEAVDKFARTGPDIVLMDVQLPVLDGIAATELILKGKPDALVLVFSSFDSESDVVRAQRAGARGYLLKSAEGSELLAAIRGVVAGDLHFGSTLSGLATGASGAPDLTVRERELLQYLVKGLNNPEIAALSHLTRGTVRIYLTRLFAKLGVTNRTEAVTAAFERGLVKPDWVDAQRGKRS